MERQSEEMEWGDICERERERIRGWLSLKIAVYRFFGTLIPLLFITKCQEAIFSFDLMQLTPS